MREDAVGLGAGDHVPVAVGTVAERSGAPAKSWGWLFSSHNDHSERAFKTAPFLPPALPRLWSLRTGKPGKSEKGYSVLSRRTPRMKLRAPGEKS